MEQQQFNEQEMSTQFRDIFKQNATFAPSGDLQISGQQVGDILLGSNLSQETLSDIWQAVNPYDQPGLTEDQFLEAIQLVYQFTHGVDLNLKIAPVKEEPQKPEPLKQEEQKPQPEPIKKQIQSQLVEQQPIEPQIISQHTEQTQRIDDSLLEDTIVSQGQSLLNVKISGMRQERQSMFKTLTYYKIETKSNLKNLYDPSRVYVVERRFNDFRQLHENLTQQTEYKGFSIPPLPLDQSISSYLVHDNAFLQKRAGELEQYLRVLTTHDKLRFDLGLQLFLTSDDYKMSYVPMQHQLKSLLRQLPEISKYGLEKDVLDAYIMMCSAKMQQPGAYAEDKNLEINLKKTEVEANLSVLKDLKVTINTQIQLQQKQANQTRRIGMLMGQLASLNIANEKSYNQADQTAPPLFDDENNDVNQLDVSQPQFQFNLSQISSSKQQEDGASQANALGHHIQQQSETVATLLGQSNLKKCEFYLNEKMTQCQGVIDALQLRESHMKGLHLKLCICNVKKEKRRSMYERSDYKKITEVDQEVAKLEGQVQDDMELIKRMNQRLVDDFQKLDRDRGTQVHKLLGNYVTAMAKTSAEIVQVYNEQPDKLVLENTKTDESLVKLKDSF